MHLDHLEIDGEVIYSNLNPQSTVIAFIPTGFQLTSTLPFKGLHEHWIL